MIITEDTIRVLVKYLYLEQLTKYDFDDTTINRVNEKAYNIIRQKIREGSTIELEEF